MFSNNPQEVADLFQEILINLWKGFPKFRGDSNVRTWIYRVSLNTCISYERKESRNKDTLPLKMDINLFDDSDEDSLFSDVKKIKNKRHLNEIENIETSKEDKKSNSVLKKLRKINGAKNIKQIT